MHNHWITDSLIIAAIPVVAYLIAYSFEVGFASFFRLPPEMVSPNLTVVFVASAVLIGSVLPILIWIAAAGGAVCLGLFHNSSWSLVCSLASLLVTCLFIVTLLRSAPFNTGWGTWLRLAASPSFAVMILSLAKSNRMDLQRILHWASSFSMRYPLSFIVLIAPVLFFVLWCSTRAGWLTAAKQRNFLVIPGPHEEIVLRIYGDKVITSSYDRDSRLVARDFTVRQPDKNDRMLMKAIGPLRPQVYYSNEDISTREMP